METLVWIIHILVSIALVVLVLLQHGKGADMGAAFGSGSAGSLFGASGSANFLSRSTAVLVTVFFLTSMGLTYFAFTKHSAPLAVQPTAPASAPAAPAGSKAQDIPN